jgi:hypothetical protein
MSLRGSDSSLFFFDDGKAKERGWVGWMIPMFGNDRSHMQDGKEYDFG